MIRHRAPALLATLYLAGCSFHVPAIPVSAPGHDLHMLQGSWNGTYEMTTGSRRTGTIVFDLEAGRDSATGMVVMTYNRESVRPHDEHAYHHPVPTSEPIAVSFVRLEDGLVSGMLAPYSDPICGCRLKTTFTGALHGSSIQGSFTTLHLDTGTVDHGTWKVVRNPRVARADAR
jgi:hypothetical protein